MTDPGALFSLAGRVACVTGASAGLGQQAATALANAGASVVGVARREDALQQWAGADPEHRAGLPFDLGDPSAIEGFATTVSKFFGSPDILVHAAGVNLRQPADSVTKESWQATQWLNLSAPFFISRQFVPHMRLQGWGRIVNFASLQTTRAFPSGIAYGASKAGVGQLTRAMAEEWSSHGINVNAVGPGFFPTELTAPVFADPERSARNAAQTCIGRNGKLEDIDGPLLFLCSEASAYVTGQVLMVDGGFTAK